MAKMTCKNHNTIFDPELAWCADCVHEEVLRVHREAHQAAQVAYERQQIDWPELLDTNEEA